MSNINARITKLENKTREMKVEPGEDEGFRELALLDSRDALANWLESIGIDPAEFLEVQNGKHFLRLLFEERIISEKIYTASIRGENHSK